VQAWISKKYPQAESVPKKDRILIKERKKCFISFLVALGFEVRASCLLVKHSSA
jgi:hypothetical protein